MIFLSEIYLRTMKSSLNLGSRLEQTWCRSAFSADCSCLTLFNDTRFSNDSGNYDNNNNNNNDSDSNRSCLMYYWSKPDSI